MKNVIGSINFAAVQQEYFTRSAAGEFSNSIKNEYEKSSLRVLNQDSGKSTDERPKIEQSAKELKSTKDIVSLSMDDLENAVSQKATVEKETAQSFDLLIGI